MTGVAFQDMEAVFKHRMWRNVSCVVGRGLCLLLWAGVSVSPSGTGQAIGQPISAGSFSPCDPSRYPKPLRAQKIVVLQSEVNGVIETVAARSGDFVAQDEPLMEFDKSLIELQVAKIRMQMEMSTSLKEAQINLEFSQQMFDIVKEMYQTPIGDSRVASQKEFNEARQRLDVAQLGERKAQLEMQVMQNDLAQNQVLLWKHTVRAPMDGVIVPFSSVRQLKEQNIKSVEVGESVTAGGIVMAMMKVDRLRVSWWLPYERLTDVQLGQAATVYVCGFEDPVAAKVVYVSPTIEDLGDQFTIEVEIENPQIQWEQLPEGSYRYRFRPAMRARVEI